MLERRWTMCTCAEMDVRTISVGPLRLLCLRVRTSTLLCVSTKSFRVHYGQVRFRGGGSGLTLLPVWRPSRGLNDDGRGFLFTKKQFTYGLLERGPTVENFHSYPSTYEPAPETYTGQDTVVSDFERENPIHDYQSQPESH